MDLKTFASSDQWPKDLLAAEFSHMDDVNTYVKNLKCCILNGILDHFGGNVNAAAKHLGVTRQHLYYNLKKLGEPT